MSGEVVRLEREGDSCCHCLNKVGTSYILLCTSYTYDNASVISYNDNVYVPFIFYYALVISYYVPFMLIIMHQLYFIMHQIYSIMHCLYQYLYNRYIHIYDMHHKARHSVMGASHILDTSHIYLTYISTICKYMQVYATMQLCWYARYASMQICKYVSM